jgi:hypothetical protein
MTADRSGGPGVEGLGGMRGIGSEWRDGEVRAASTRRGSAWRRACGGLEETRSAEERSRRQLERPRQEGTCGVSSEKPRWRTPVVARRRPVATRKGAAGRRCWRREEEAR